MEQNPLYPVFLKLDRLKMLIIGAGVVGHEKLFFILKNSPNPNIKIVSKEVSTDVTDLIAEKKVAIEVEERAWEEKDIQEAQIILAATNDRATNLEIYEVAKKYDKIINVADTPDLCDFYLGSVVTRGNLKVGISTNGKSPTFAKRLREILEEGLPHETNELLDHLEYFRNQLRGDFEHKVKELNELTASLKLKNKDKE
ncbi:precorrin-2 dehydrogenase/sirohydrochlorin ferrochelatase family protein [Sediminitomix flava]|uniref:precorrin-2 dehydrogenase n=1 Tax=Sediminitomix flava TaxID=379075 RepID=A0A315ZCI8_SEDFL|nr:bifunctional precorrin-2 dehydrogenase/sirohydrochlorin ferrochelatase [Sediminitomix flava]PWJ43030.1 precorrin-2 dehydrogenase/sirohydrochlorin ferrochelatase [Sediminitomix flava]